MGELTISNITVANGAVVIEINEQSETIVVPVNVISDLTEITGNREEAIKAAIVFQLKVNDFNFTESMADERVRKTIELSPALIKAVIGILYPLGITVNQIESGLNDINDYELLDENYENYGSDEEYIKSNALRISELIKKVIGYTDNQSRIEEKEYRGL